jgi:peptidoglycan/xylan/chitin deacetylase (PgdA/CDA1 family)
VRRPAEYAAAVARRSRRAAVKADAHLQRRRAARASDRGTGVILLYHRVAETQADPWGNAVTPERFAEHLEALQAEMSVCSLAELSASIDHGSVPARSVAVVFDDGYADNLTQALPALERHQTPATLFVATGFIGSDGPYWWDELTDLLLGPGERPAVLEASLAGRPIVAPTRTREERRTALLTEVHPALSSLPPALIDAALAPVRAWAADGSGGPTVNGTGGSAARPMSAEELERFAASPLVELGAHTRSHPRMPHLSRSDQRTDVLAGRRALADITGREPRFFAYPFGDASRRSERIVRAAGFERAFGSRWALPVTAASRRFETPRIAVTEEDAPSLIRRVDRILGNTV